MGTFFETQCSCASLLTAVVGTSVLLHIPNTT